MRALRLTMPLAVRFEEIRTRFEGEALIEEIRVCGCEVEILIKEI